MGEVGVMESFAVGLVVIDGVGKGIGEDELGL